MPHSMLPSVSFSSTLKDVRLLIASAAITLCGCDPLAGTGVWLDCLDDDGPILTPRELPAAVLNQSYEAIITASIENEPYDDRFHFDFNVGSSLTTGLSVNEFEREVRISGAPTELGVTAMRIEVVVADESGGAGETRLCRKHTARNYVIPVQQQHPPSDSDSARSETI